MELFVLTALRGKLPMLLDPYSTWHYFNGVFHFTSVQLKNSAIAAFLIFILLQDEYTLKKEQADIFLTHKGHRILFS